MITANRPDYTKPNVLGAAIHRALKQVDDRFIFGELQDNGLRQVGVGPEPYGGDVVTFSSSRVVALASDPAHSGKVNAGNIQEAVIGLMAQHLKAVPSLTRETTGAAEFIEPSGQTWDVKSPVSPPAMPSTTWTFDAGHQINKLRDEFGGSDNVLLDLSRCNPTDSKFLVALMMNELSPAEKSRLLVFYDVKQS